MQNKQRPSTQAQASQSPIASDELISIPTKISDGIFMADQYIAQDVQWLSMNQVTHIINCAGKHCKNLMNMSGVNFLTYQWSENNIQNILDQNVIGASISFIQEAKKAGGSVLVHCSISQSRPFCILAAYLMIRYQWNLFKTLEFLNSRKQDIQLEPAFFQQLTSLHQKLQQRGLIKSKNWTLTDGMSDEQIILSNTFLNSRKKQNLNNQNTNKSQNLRQSHAKNNSKFTKKLIWRNEMHVMHVYSPLTILAQLNPKRNSRSVQPKQQSTGNLRNSRQRAESINQKSTQNIKKEAQIVEKIENFQSKDTITNQRQSLLSEMNVTRKWAQLRQSWMKQKEKENNQLLHNQSQQNGLEFKEK